MRWLRYSNFWISILAIAQSGCTNLESFDVVGTAEEFLFGNPTPILINGGAPYTNDSSGSVDLSLDQEGASEMVIANTLEDCQTDSAWVAFDSVIEGWILDSTQLNTTASVWAKFRNELGDETECFSDSIIHDSTPPLVSLDTPASGSFVSQAEAFTIRGSCEADQGPVAALPVFPGGTSSEFFGTCSSGTYEITLDVSDLPEGSFTVNVSHMDLAGNSSSTPASSSFTKDVSAPSVAITAPAPNSWISAANQMNITVSGTCSLEDVNQPIILGGNGALPDGAPTPICNSSGNWTAQLEFLADNQGPLTVTADFKDQAGNSAPQSTLSLIKDTEIPTGSLAINSGATYTTVGAVSLAMSASDNLSSSSSISMYITNTAGCASGGTWEPLTSSRSWNLANLNSTATIYARFKDAAGNSSSCFGTSIIHDDMPPMVSFRRTFPRSPSYAADPHIYGDAVDTNGIKLIELFGNDDQCMNNRLGSITDAAAFNTTGLQITVPTEFNDIYALAIDNAGLPSPCTLLTSYQKAPSASFAFMEGGTSGNESGSGKIGAREGAVTWFANGKAWLFGGYGKGEQGAVGYLNDLWRKDPNGWVLVAGSPTVDAPPVYVSPGSEGTPGGRAYATGWVDHNGWLWLFGGLGLTLDGSGNLLPADDLSDVWAFDGEKWIWKGGPATGGDVGTAGSPSSREGAVSWYQKGQDGVEYAYVFGGLGYGKDGSGNDVSGYLNDLWKLQLNTFQWSRISGDSLVNAKTTGTAPGSRDSPVAWSTEGKLWLFGGNGIDSNNAAGHLSDLWYWDIGLTGTNKWKYVNGPMTRDEKGVRNDPSNNHPGGRTYALGWSDLDGNLWLFGGWGLPTNGTELGHLNDVWRFNGTSWSFVAGVDATNPPSSSVQPRRAEIGNAPSGRSFASGWRDAAGEFWLFGGSNGTDPDPAMNPSWNDFWKFIPPVPATGTPPPPPSN